MESTTRENLSSILDEVKRLKLLGKEMQLTEEEISECARNALETQFETNLQKYQRYFLLYIEELKPLLKDTRQWFNNFKSEARWTRTAKALLMFIILFTLALIYHMMFGLEGPLGKAFVVLFAPYDHICMRYVRLFALPMHTLFNIASLHNSPCFVYNPLYREMIPENCWGCDKVNRTRVATSNNRTMPPFVLSRPTLFRNYTQEHITIKNITDVITQHYDVLKDPSILIKSSVPWLKRPIDLLSVENLEEKIMSSPKFSFMWTSRRMKTSQILRLLFPRPIFINKKSEVTLVRQLVINGPGANPYLLTEDADGTILYKQHLGNRTLDFVAKPGCEQKCIKFQTVIREGDIISLPAIWDIYVLANGDGMSIASVSFVDLQ